MNLWILYAFSIRCLVKLKDMLRQIKRLNMFYNKLLFKTGVVGVSESVLLRSCRCNDTPKHNDLVAQMTNTRAKCILYHQPMC